MVLPWLPLHTHKTYKSIPFCAGGVRETLLISRLTLYMCVLLQSDRVSPHWHPQPMGTCYYGFPSAHYKPRNSEILAALLSFWSLRSYLPPRLMTQVIPFVSYYSVTNLEFDGFAWSHVNSTRRLFNHVLVANDDSWRSGWRHPETFFFKNKKKKKTMIDCRPSHTSWSSPETRIIMPLAAIGKLTSFFLFYFFVGALSWQNSADFAN